MESKTKGEGTATNLKKVVDPAQTVKVYFLLKTKDSPSQSDESRGHEMAGAIPAEASSEDLVKNCDLADMEQLIKSLSALFLPLTEQLKTLNEKLEEANKKEKGAFEKAASANDCAVATQRDVIALSEKVLLMDISNRQLNITLCGFSEREKGKENLQASIAFWLAKEMCLEERVAPTVTRAFRIGVQNSSYRKGPET